MKMTPRRLFGNLIVLGLMIGILAFDHWIFQRLFGVTHWRWYIENGVEISFVAAAMALVWKEILELMPSLISAEPAVFFGAQFHLVGVCVEALGVQLGSAPGQPRNVGIVEMILGVPFILLLACLLAGWLLVVAPAQYFLVLICGAPARILARSPQKLVMWFENGRLHSGTVPRDQEVPDDRMVASFSERPVAVTNMFASLLLFILQFCIGREG
jgi:hypothetical protein